MKLNGLIKVLKSFKKLDFRKVVPDVTGNKVFSLLYIFATQYNYYLYYNYNNLFKTMYYYYYEKLYVNYITCK